MKITELQLVKKKRQLSNCLKVMDNLKNEIAEAIKLGDFKENSELQHAKQEYSLRSLEKSDLEQIIDTAEIITDSDSDTIDLGSLIKVNCISDPSLGEMLLVVSEQGDSIIEGILNVNSPLGRAVRGRVSGLFNVECEQHVVTYQVNKVTTKDFEEKSKVYSELYPDQEEFFKAYYKMD